VKALNLRVKLREGQSRRSNISPIEKGIKEKMENGVMAGFPMVDMRAVVYDGSYHEVDSSEIAFR